MSKKKFLVVPDINLDFDSLDLILKKHDIYYEILSQCPENDNQWVLETNKNHEKQILEKQNDGVKGSHNKIVYWLKFYPIIEGEMEEEKYLEKQEPRSEVFFSRNEKKQNSADTHVSEGATLCPQQTIKSFPMRKADEDQRTLLVTNVPHDFDLNFLKQFLENKNLCNGGNIDKMGRIGTSWEIEVTFEDKTVVDDLLKSSSLKLNNWTFEIRQKKKKLYPSLMEELKSDSAKKEMKKEEEVENLKTIEVHGIPIGMNLEIVKLFFENRKFGYEGKIENVKRDNITLSALVKFSSSKDATLVAKHGEYTIRGHKCNVSLYRDFEGTCFFLSDLKSDLSEDVIIDFLEAKTDIDVVKALPTESESIWMVFTSETVNFPQVQELCENKTLLLMSDTFPKVSPVPRSNMVLVRDWQLGQGLNENMIELYFQGCTKNVKSVERYSEEGFLVTFHNYVDLITLCQTTHKIKDKEVFVVPFYQTQEICNEEFNLGSCLKLELVKENRKSVERLLQPHVKPIWSASFGKILKFQANSTQGQADMSLKNLMQEIYEDTVELSSAEIRTTEEQLRKKEKTANLIARVDCSSQTLNIVALGQNTISEFKQSFSLPRKFSTNPDNKTMNLESYKIHLLFANRVPQKIQKTYPKVNIKGGHNQLFLEGDSSDLAAVEIEILKILTNIHSTLVPVPENTSYLLDKSKAKNYVIGLFKMKSCNVSWKINTKKELTIYSLNSQQLNAAETILKNCIKEFSFEITDSIRNLIKERKWLDFLDQIKDKYSNEYYFDQKLLCGVALDTIEKEIKSDFEEFFERNDVALMQETISLEKNQSEYLKANEMKSIKEFCESFGTGNPVTIGIRPDDKIDIRASKKNMKAAVEFIENFIKRFNEMKTVLGGSNATRPKTKELQTVFQMKYKSQIMIVKEGDITQLQVDAIVNAANKEMMHGGGIAKAIVDAGGQVIQTESTEKLKKLGGPIPVGGGIVTSAGALPCKFVIHVVGPIWKGGKFDEDKLLKNAVKKALKISDEKIVTSIAYSAISAGSYKYPLDQALNVMVSTIKKYLDKNVSTHLKTIYFVDTRHAVTLEFQEQLCKVLRSETFETEKSKISNSSPKSNPKPNPTPQTPTVFIRKGELQKIKADIIVCSISSDFDFKKGILSNTILQSAGSGLLAECKNIPNLGTFETYVSKGYKLPCNNIIFLSPPFQKEANMIIGTYVEDCLRLASSMNATSIAFPSLGTGQAGYPPTEVAKNMLFKAYNFLQQKTTLQEIFIIIYPRDTGIFKAFQNESKNISKVSGVNIDIEDPGPTSFVPVSLAAKPKTSLMIGSVEVFVLNGDLLDQRTTAIVHCTDDKFSLKGAISRCLCRKVGNQFVKDCQNKASEMSKNHFAWTNGNTLSCKLILHLDIVSQISAPTKILETCFREAETYKISSLSLPHLATNGTSISLDEMADALWDTLHSSKKYKFLKKVEVVLYQTKAVTDFMDCIRKAQMSLQIPRSIKPSDILSMTKLQSNDAEYQKVHKEFLSSVKRIPKIISIELIENKPLKIQYKMQLEKIKALNPQNQINERTLWHGTKVESITAICKNGFDRSYCGHNGTWHGRGVYFAVNAEYSDQDMYTPRDTNNNKHILMCRVATGSYVNGNSSMDYLPLKPNSQQKYDTAVNNAIKPTVFIIFNDVQAYPKYHITYQ